MMASRATGGVADAWAADARAHGAPTTTIRTRRSHIHLWEQSIGDRIFSPDPGDIVEYLWSNQWAGSTRRSHWITLRSLYKWAVETGRSASDPTVGLTPPRPVRGEPRPAPEWAIQEAWDNADPCERIWIDLAGRHGMRRTEIAIMRMDDIVPDTDGYSVRVHGKGGKERIIPLHKDTMAALSRQFSSGGGGGVNGWLWPGDDDGHISPWWLGRRIADVLPDGWTIHTLRHRAATVWFENSRDIVAVSKLLGHSSIATTQTYVATDRSAARRIIDQS